MLSKFVPGAMIPRLNSGTERLMRAAKPFIALALIVWSSVAFAETWVKVPGADPSVLIDRDSIRRGDDTLVYFTRRWGDTGELAVNCTARISYVLTLSSMAGSDMSAYDWRANGSPIAPGSESAAELRYVCSVAR
jgi:hypothetical protein